MKFTNEEIEHSWNDFAETWTGLTGKAGDICQKTLIIPSMLRLLGDVKDQRVLDIACGTGIFTRYLARQGAHVAGIDLSMKMLNKAIEFEKKQPLGIAYHHCTATRINMSDDRSFNAVTCNMSLMDIPDFEEVFSEANRVLKDRGRFVFSILHPCFCTPGAGWIRRGLFSKWGDKRLYWRVDHYFERRSGKGVFDQALNVYFHRTLGDYVNGLIHHGFIIKEIDEPKPPQGQSMPLGRIAGFLIVCANKRD